MAFPLLKLISGQLLDSKVVQIAWIQNNSTLGSGSLVGCPELGEVGVLRGKGGHRVSGDG